MLHADATDLLFTCNDEKIQSQKQIIDEIINANVNWNNNNNFYKICIVSFNAVMSYLYYNNDEPFIICFAAINLLMGTVGIIPYYMTPEIKYDLFK